MKNEAEKQQNPDIKEVKIGLSLVDSILNRAIFNHCSIILFDKSNPEKFDYEVRELASKHANTATIYKDLEGNTIMASDLYFNPYSVKTIASVHREFEDKASELLDGMGFEMRGKQYHINDVFYSKDDEEIKVDYENLTDNTEHTRGFSSFYYWLTNNENETISQFDFKELKDLWTEISAKEEEEESLKNSPEYGTNKGILKVLSENQDDIKSIHTSYSGRGMYGKECFGIVVESYSNIEDELEKYDVMGRTDNMGHNTIIYWPSLTYEKLKSEDTEGVLNGFDISESTIASSESSSTYALKPMLEELESEGYKTIDEGSEDEITVYVYNTDEEFTEDIFLALIFGSTREYNSQVDRNPLPKASYELVDIVDSGFKSKYPGKYKQIEDIAQKHEKKDEADAVRMESLASSDNSGKYNSRRGKMSSEAGAGDHYVVFFDEKLDGTISEALGTDAVLPLDNGLDLQRMIEAGHERAKRLSKIKKFTGFKIIRGYLGHGVQKELTELIPLKYENTPAEALHPKQKGGQEIKLRKIADKHIDEIAKHAHTGIVQHAILDPKTSDLNEAQISSVRKALVEVGNRNMGHDRVRKEGKEGVIAGSDIAEFASWITSDCMALTADYLMDNIDDRNAQETYTFAKSKLEDCLMDFYRTETNRSNYPEIYAFWEDLIYGQRAFGAGEEAVDFFTVYLMKEKTEDEIQFLCDLVSEAFDTSCSIVDNSAFNVYRKGKLRGNEKAEMEVSNFVGQSEILEIA